MPVEKMAPFFDEDFGRPTKEMYTALGAVVLQQAHDLSDEETVFELAFNEAWHYALDIPDESDAAKYISPKTLWNLRKIVTDNGLDGVLFEKITGKLVEVFKVDTGKQRLDSVHIKSNMRRLGRIGIFAGTIRKFLVNLKRQHRDLFDQLEPELVDKYLPKKGLGCFSFVKPSESAKKLSEVAVDLFELVRRFAGNDDVCGMSSYKLLVRVLEEQCRATEASNGKPAEVSVKPAREVPSDSLQNPSDPDAAYDGHKGQGYQVQIMEAYSDDEDEKSRDETPNLITHVEVEPANESDANALMPAIESTEERGLKPEQVLADSLYGSDDNVKEAEEKGVELVAPTPEFKDRYRYRAGVEATMSELDRRTGIKQMRVRGLPAVRASARLKAVGLNIFRAACTRRAKKASDGSPSRVYPCPTAASKEVFSAVGGVFSSILEGICSSCRRVAGFLDPEATIGSLAPTPAL